MILEHELLSHFPADTPVPAQLVADAVAASGRVLVVLDDDPTGTQSVAGLPVLTSWDREDFRWAFDGGARPRRSTCSPTRAASTRRRPPSEIARSS